LTESLATALVSAKRFEIEIKEKVSTKTLNKVILLKRSTPHFTGLGK
jgi:hypothetical protein